MLRAFLLEDNPLRIAAFQRALVGFQITIAKTRDQAEAAWAPPYDLVLLDNDLGEDEEMQGGLERDNTGLAFVKANITSRPTTRDGAVVCHSLNEPARKAIVAALKPYVFCCSVPFSTSLIDILAGLKWVLEEEFSE